MIDTTKMKIHVNILMVEGNFDDLTDFARTEGFTQLSLLKGEDGWSLSTPLDYKAQLRYQWLYHRMKAQKPDTDPEPTPTGPKPPKGTPPSGGTPGSVALELPQEELLMVA